MNEDVFNTSLRGFLKKVGITSQREIEKAVRDALAFSALARQVEQDAPERRLGALPAGRRHRRADLQLRRHPRLEHAERQLPHAGARDAVRRGVSRADSATRPK